MKVARTIVLATTILAFAAPAAAQVNAHASLGYASASKTFDKDGDRQSQNGDSSLLAIHLGGAYRFFKGLGVGLDLGVVRVSMDPDTEGAKSSEGFGLQDLTLGLIWNTIAGPAGELDASFGFAIDFGTKDQDLKTDGSEIPTSDRQHALVGSIKYTHKVHPLVNLHLRFGFALPLERQEDDKNGVKGSKHDAGFVADPSFGVGYHHPSGFSGGLDIGFFHQSDVSKTVDTTTGKEKTDSANLFHLTPWIGWALGPQQHLRLMVAVQDEYAMLGLPLSGKNKEIAVFPVTLGWHGSF